MTNIEPQEDAESLESLVEPEEKNETSIDIDKLTESFSKTVEETEPETTTEQAEPEKVDYFDMSAEDKSNGIPEPELIETNAVFFVPPAELEEAHRFLNQFGIRTDKLTDQEVMAKIDRIREAKPIASQVLSRGRALDGIERMLSFVPEGYIGEFKRENDIDVSRARALGFEVFQSEAANTGSSTGKSDGLVRFGDQILMIIREETYVANRLVKAERAAARRQSHNYKAGSQKTQIDQGSASTLFPLIQL
jgi:hypothetical protein